MSDTSDKKPKIKPPPLLVTEVHMIEFDEDTWGPLKYQAFERANKTSPWQHLGSSSDLEGAKQLLETERAQPSTLVERLRRKDAD